MRVVVAMIFALAVAGSATLAISHNVADNIVAGQRFTMPGEAARFHALVYMTTNLLALVCGYGLGWVIGYPLRRRPQGT
ncbi:MAG TPA: hypothetical protein PKD49_02270 [Hyphomicrobium sp.]|nr:hypothetical protein [Hyphomicrobium sp.]